MYLLEDISALPSRCSTPPFWLTITCN